MITQANNIIQMEKHIFLQEILRTWKDEDNNIYRLIKDRDKLYITVNDKSCIGPAKYIEDFDKIVDTKYLKYPELFRFINGVLKLSKSCEKYRYKPEIIANIEKDGYSLAIRKDYDGYTLILNNVIGPKISGLDEAIRILKNRNFKPWLNLFLKIYPYAKAKVISK